eukprot:Phypoly_transcript_00441.p1 GENE.Phypoly_transcript_00441~~Phypoly_transcript_00441.p1  ORF type:complete len:1585 (+),score=566.32 Phypoly_transcript_00441:138-4757(+)
MTVTPPTETAELDFPNQEAAPPNPEILAAQLEQQRAEEREQEEEERREKERQEEQRKEDERLKEEEKIKQEERRKEEERIKEEKRKEQEARELKELEERLERERKEEEERLERERKEEEERLEQERREEEERLENERREREEQERKDRERREQERLEQERIEKERQEQERLEKEREEQERIERERQEAERREKERLEIERLEKERLEKLEQERLEIERQEQERIEKERLEREEQERLEKERIEKERLERIEKERQEQEQLERELEQERLEQERIEKEEEERREKERLELIETEKQAQERLEQEKREKEEKEKKRLEKARLKKEKLERERKKREEERLEKERLEKEEKDRLEAERIEKERLRKEQLEKERLEKERLEKEKIEQERLERERLEKERLEKERLEKERLAKEKAEKKRIEKERLEKEREEKERLEKERIEQERLEKERIEKERQERREKEKQEKARREKEKKERLEKERIEKERLEKERIEKERQERERLEKEREEKEREEKEKQERERKEKEKQERERVERERQEKERQEKERKEKEKQEKEKADKKMDAKNQVDIFAEDDALIGNGVAAKKPVSPKTASPVPSAKKVLTGASIFDDDDEPELFSTPAPKVVKKRKPRTATIEAPKSAKPAATAKDAQVASPDKPAETTKKITKTKRKSTTATAVPEPAPVPAEPAPAQDAPIPDAEIAQPAEAPAAQEPAQANATPAQDPAQVDSVAQPTTPPSSRSITSSASTSSSNLQAPSSGNPQSTSPASGARTSANDVFSVSSISRSAGAMFKDFDRFTKKTVHQVQEQIAKTDKMMDKVLSPTAASTSATSLPLFPTSSTPSALPTYPSAPSLPLTSTSLPPSPAAPSPVSALSHSSGEVPSDSAPLNWWETAAQNLTQKQLHHGLAHAWDTTVQHTTDELPEKNDTTFEPKKKNKKEVWDATVHPTPAPAPAPAPATTPSGQRATDPLTKITHDALVAFRKDNGTTEVLFPFLKLWIAQFKPAEFPLSQLGSENAKNLQTEFAQVSDLANACFEFQIFEGSPENFIVEYFSFLDVDQVIAACMQHRLGDCFGVVFKLDEEKAPQRDANLVALERFLRDRDGYNAQALLRSTKKSLMFSARILPQFFESAPKDAINYTVSLYPKIRPWFVEWRISENLPRYYIDYLTALLSTREECRKNQNFVHSFFGHCLRTAAPNREDLFSNSQPVRGAHKREWGYAESLIEVIQNEYQVYSRNSEHLQHMCEKAGFFPGLLQLYLLHGQIRQAVDLVVCTDDEPGLFHVLSDSSDSEMWSCAMQRMQQMRADFAQPNPESEFAITKDAFLKFMIRRLGPLPAMQLLLKETEFAKSGISHEAYKVFTTMGKVEIREKRPLVYEMLSTIDSYLWSRKPKAVCPQIRYVFELESSLQDASLQNVNLQNANMQFPQQPSTLPSYLDQPSIPGTPVALKFDLENFPVFYEEATGHWGAETEFSNGTCPLCTLPLLENPEGSGLGLGSGPTVLIFPKCGHAFHGFCNENDHACSVCVVNNITPWSSATKSSHSSQYSI